MLSTEIKTVIPAGISRHGDTANFEFYTEDVIAHDICDKMIEFSDINMSSRIRADLDHKSYVNRMLRLRQKAIKEGMKLLSCDEVIEEVKRRRGEIS